jgi:hypothetical protein
MRLVVALVALFSVAALPVRAQIERPRLGFVLDSSGALRPVLGEASSATLGDPLRDPAGGPALSFACSSQLCLIKTDAAVVAFRPDRPDAAPSVAAPPGPALIALDDRGAWIYFQAGGQLAWWHDGLLDFADFAGDGALLSLRATVGGFDYTVARDGGTWTEHYSSSDGAIAVVDWAAVNSTSAAPAAMLFDGGILLSSMDHVTLRRPDGREMAYPLAGDKKFHAAGNGYIEIVAPGSSWILRTDFGREQLFLLPGMPE